MDVNGDKEKQSDNDATAKSAQKLDDHVTDTMTADAATDDDVYDDVMAPSAVATNIAPTVVQTKSVITSKKISSTSAAAVETKTRSTENKRVTGREKQKEAAKVSVNQLVKNANFYILQTWSWWSVTPVCALLCPYVTFFYRISFCVSS